jgi:hypothetical protein
VIFLNFDSLVLITHCDDRSMCLGIRSCSDREIDTDVSGILLPKYKGYDKWKQHKAACHKMLGK